MVEVIAVYMTVVWTLEHCNNGIRCHCNSDDRVHWCMKTECLLYTFVKSTQVLLITSETYLMY